MTTRKQKNEAYTTIQIQKKSGKKRTYIDLKLKIDTGAQSDILPVNLYKKMIQEDKVKEGILTLSDVILTAFGGPRIPQLGKATITGTHRRKIIKCSFYVTKTEGPAVLGLDTRQKLNTVSINSEVKAAPSRIDRDMPIKDLTKSPARLQRPQLRLQKYDNNIRYKPAKNLILADALSRLSSHDKQEMEGLSVKVHHIVNVTNTKLEQIKEETSKDEELQLLTQMVIQEWPEKRHQVQPLIREYWAIHDGIAVEKGILMAGSRIIMPKSMQKEILEKIHQGASGNGKMQTLSQWKGLSPVCTLSCVLRVILQKNCHIFHIGMVFPQCDFVYELQPQIYEEMLSHILHNYCFFPECNF
uniref:Peptidase A2 domain-containing protein n=1 Tax=Octopus bimaculoides TaxID=37653 RepID=A0A0L8FGB6_OCTBM